LIGVTELTYIHFVITQVTLLW